MHLRLCRATLSLMEREVAEHFERDLAEAAAGQRAHQPAIANLDDLLTKLAAAQLVTEQKLQRFLDGPRAVAIGTRDGNGRR